MDPRSPFSPLDPLKWRDRTHLSRGSENVPEVEGRGLGEEGEEPA